MKSKNIVYYIVSLGVFIIMLTAVFYARYRIIDNVEEGKETQEEEQKEIISKETYEMLIAECQDKENKTRIQEHLQKDWKYAIQDEIEHNGKIYKSIYIRYSDYEYGTGNIVEKELSYMPEYAQKIEECMREENLIDSGDEGTGLSELGFDPAHCYKQEKWDVITLERYKEFKFMENWVATALLICDKEGNIENILTFNGAIGTSLKPNDDKLVWEVFICKRLDAYIWGSKKNEENINVGLNGQVSGEVYEIVIDSENDISDILYVRNSSDNNIFDLYRKPYEHSKTSAMDKIYVENQDLTIIEFINAKETLINRNASIRSIFGHEHTNLSGRPDNPIYFTTDGYVVKAGPGQILYCKYPKEDFLDMGFYERWVDFKEMFIDGEVNPELLKEIEEN